jgi:hypothetical protein
MALSPSDIDEANPAVHFLRNIRRLSPRVASEAARRGQPVPKINLPQAS